MVIVRSVEVSSGHRSEKYILCEVKCCLLHLECCFTTGDVS